MAAGAGLVPEGQNPAKNIKKYREPTRERFLTSEELARLGEALREGETVGLPYSVDEPRRQRSTPRRPTIGALNLTESTRRARPCAICRREPGHAGGSAQHLAPPVAVDAEGEDRRRRKTLASGSFSARTRRLIISSVIGGSSVALVDLQPEATDEPPATTPSSRSLQFYNERAS